MNLFYKYYRTFIFNLVYICTILFSAGSNAQVYIGGGLGYSFLDTKISKFPVIIEDYSPDDNTFSSTSSSYIFSTTSTISAIDTRFIDFSGNTLTSEGRIPPNPFIPITGLGATPGPITIHQEEHKANWKVFTGYQTTSVIGIELSYIDFGTARPVISTNTTLASGIITPDALTYSRQEITIKSTGLSLSGIFKYPTKGTVSPFARVGIISWREEVTSSLSFSATNSLFSPSNVPTAYSKKDGNAINLGFGIEYQFRPQLSLRLEYEHFDDVDGRYIDTIGINLKANFGG